MFVRLRGRGFQARIVSVSHLHQLQEEIEGLRSHALLDGQFYQDRLAWFNFQVPEDLPKARSLIVVAVPRPQTRAIFTWNGRRRPLIIPPTYTANEGHKKTSWRLSRWDTRRKRLRFIRNCVAPQIVGGSEWSCSVRQEQCFLCFWTGKLFPTRSCLF